MYLAYDDYMAMGGKLGYIEYEDYGYRAQDYLDTHTMGRLKNAVLIPDKVKRVLKRLTEIIYKYEIQPIITSESNEGMSVSYAVVKPVAEQMLDIIDTLKDVEIDGIPLLYRGV